eukprot:1156950-Pyramimonas_sp.AAC.1
MQRTKRRSHDGNKSVTMSSIWSARKHAARSDICLQERLLATLVVKYSVKKRITRAPISCIAVESSNLALSSTVRDNRTFVYGGASAGHSLVAP